MQVLLTKKTVLLATVSNLLKSSTPFWPQAPLSWPLDSK